jgi:hypothetical protein
MLKDKIEKRKSIKKKNSKQKNIAIKKWGPNMIQKINEWHLYIFAS